MVAPRLRLIKDCRCRMGHAPPFVPQYDAARSFSDRKASALEPISHFNIMASSPASVRFQFLRKNKILL
jgi:hypothetical protein